MCCLFLLTWIRLSLYEFFLKSHLLLAVLIVMALWRHLIVRLNFTRIYVIIVVSIFVITTLLRYSRILFRQSSWSHSYATSRVIQVHKANDAFCLEIDVRRSWNVRAEQYVYIWMSFCSFWSLFQSHSFMITWWSQNAHDRVEKIYLLIKFRYEFTRKLLKHLNASTLRTWVDDSYDKEKNLENFESVLMFASEIDIVAQISYIKKLFANIKKFKVRTRSILLMWQLKKESKSHRSLFASQTNSFRRSKMNAGMNESSFRWRQESIRKLKSILYVKTLLKSHRFYVSSYMFCMTLKARRLTTMHLKNMIDIQAFVNTMENRISRS